MSDDTNHWSFPALGINKPREQQPREEEIDRKFVHISFVFPPPRRPANNPPPPDLDIPPEEGPETYPRF